MPDHTKDDILQRASVIAKRAQIDNVRLVHSNISRNQIANPVSDVEIEFAFKTPKHELDKDTNEVLVFVGLMAAGKEDDSDLFKIEAFFALHYHIRGDEPIAEDDLTAFSSANGLFNVWPYWREYAQSSAARMGLDSVVMPVLTGGMVARMLQDQPDNKATKPKLTHTLKRAGAPSGKAPKKAKRKPKS